MVFWLQVRSVPRIALQRWTEQKLDAEYPESPRPQQQCHSKLKETCRTCLKIILVVFENVQIKMWLYSMSHILCLSGHLSTLYTRNFLHHEPFAPDSSTPKTSTTEIFYTKRLLHQKPFLHQKLLHQEPFTPDNFEGC